MLNAEEEISKKNPKKKTKLFTKCLIPFCYKIKWGWKERSISLNDHFTYFYILYVLFCEFIWLCIWLFVYFVLSTKFEVGFFYFSAYIFTGFYSGYCNITITLKSILLVADMIATGMNHNLFINCSKHFKFISNAVIFENDKIRKDKIM